jgi:hypothetical protein
MIWSIYGQNNNSRLGSDHRPYGKTSPDSSSVASSTSRVMQRGDRGSGRRNEDGMIDDNNDVGRRINHDDHFINHNHRKVDDDPNVPQQQHLQQEKQ